MNDVREQIKEEVAAALGDAWLSNHPTMDRSSLLPLCPTASSAEDISRGLLDLQAEHRAERVAGAGWRSTESDVKPEAKEPPSTAAGSAAPSLREQIVTACADAEKPLTSHDWRAPGSTTQKRISVDLPGLVKKGLLETDADVKPRTWRAPGKLYKARTDLPRHKSTAAVHTQTTQTTPEPAEPPAPAEDSARAGGRSEFDDVMRKALLEKAVRANTAAILALTRSAQAAQHALEAYISSLNDPVLTHLLACADHAERARERLTNGNAEEA